MNDYPTTSRQRGASAVVIAGSLLMIMGFVAVAVDLGAGFTERRRDQTAADLGATGGATAADQGVSAIASLAQNTTDANLAAPADWAGCTDPGRMDPSQNGGQTGFSPIGGDCVSLNGLGFLRVRVPNQETATSFGRVLGVDSITTSAAAVARIQVDGIGGILPFGLGSGAGGGEHLCLSQSPSGLSDPDDPCSGPTTGNFGTLKVPLWGNDDPDYQTPNNCNAAPLGGVLATNIAHGIDHFVTLYEGTAIRDDFANCNGARVVSNTLNTDTGFPNNGAEQGIATGPIPDGVKGPRLQQSGPTALRFGHQLNDVPLWTHLIGDLGPSECYRSGFFPDPYPDPASWIDWDGDGVADPPDSWQHMQACLAAHESGSTIQIFDESIKTNARFAYVPQFTTEDLGNGSEWLRIARFRAVFLQSTTWRSGNSYKVFHPGEPCSGCTGNYSMINLSAFTIPDAALPEALRSTGGGTGVNPFTVELFR